MADAKPGDDFDDGAGKVACADGLVRCRNRGRPFLVPLGRDDQHRAALPIEYDRAFTDRPHAAQDEYGIRIEE